MFFLQPLIDVLKVPEARSTAISALGLIMDEAVVEAYEKEDGEKLAKDASLVPPLQHF